MTDHRTTLSVFSGLAGLLFLLFFQTVMTITGDHLIANGWAVSAGVLLLGIAITFYVIRQMRGQEVACDVESARARGAIERLKWQASHDPLTGLPNRREFRRRALDACTTAGSDGRRHALALINLDRFKTINDHCGHRAGDMLLRQLPGLLAPILPGRVTLARIAGDEFGVLMPDTEIGQAREVAESICKAIREFRFCWANRYFEIGASIGVVPVHPDYCRLQEVLTAADTACQEAKNTGRNRVCVLEASNKLLARRQGEVRCAQELPRAIRDDRLELYAQEIRAMDEAYSGKHYELLVRMKHEDGSQMQPDQFIPVAEQYGLAVDVDRWVVREALQWLQVQGRSISACSLGDQCHCKCRLSINLSGQSISDQGFLEEVRGLFEQFRVDPDRVIFEITETAAVTSLGAARHFIEVLKGIGCRFALDDFGSGMSSFGYLQELDVDYVKIDGSLVSRVAKGGLENAMINAIVHVANHMNARTIAEYVEDQLTRKSLEYSGVDFVQGFLVHKPTPLKDLRFCADEMAETQQLALAM